MAWRMTIADTPRKQQDGYDTVLTVTYDDTDHPGVIRHRATFSVPLTMTDTADVIALANAEGIRARAAYEWSLTVAEAIPQGTSQPVSDVDPLAQQTTPDEPPVDSQPSNPPVRA